MSLPKINHTQISNAFIDHWMRRISPSSTQIFLVISRKTIGWRKETDRISQGQISKFAGISEDTVKRGLRELKEFGLITASGGGSKRGDVISYEVNYDEILKEGVQNQPHNHSEGVQITLPSGEIRGADLPPTKEKDLNKEEKKPPEAGKVVSSFSKEHLDLFWKLIEKHGALPGTKKGNSDTFHTLKAYLQRLSPSQEEITGASAVIEKWFSYFTRKSLWSPDENERMFWATSQCKMAIELVRTHGVEKVNEVMHWGVNDDFWKTTLSSLKSFPQLLRKVEAEKEDMDD